MKTLVKSWPKIDNVKKLIKNNETTWGYVLGFLAIFFYAVINVISQAGPKDTGLNTIIYSLIFVIVKEFVATILSVLFNKHPLTNIIKIAKSIKADWKGAFWSSIAGIFGGAIGFTLTTAGSIYVGSALGSPIYALEIVFVFLFMRFAMKRKSNIIQKLGMGIVFIGTIFIPISSIIFDGLDNSKNAGIGILLLALGVLSWSVESIIFDLLSENKKRDISTMVFFKQISSLLVGLIILLPVFGAIETSTPDAYQEFGTLFDKNYVVLILGCVCGALLYFGRLLFFTSVKHVGATTGNAIYSALPFVQTPIAYISNLIGPLLSNGTDFVGNIHHEVFWILIIVILVGIIVSFIGQNKNGKKRL